MYFFIGIILILSVGFPLYGYYLDYKSNPKQFDLSWKDILEFSLKVLAALIVPTILHKVYKFLEHIF